MQPQTTHLDINVHEQQQQQPTKMQSLDSHDSESNGLIYRLPNLPNTNMRDGETYAFYVKDGAAYLKPLNPSSETSFIEWLVKFDKVIQANAYSYQSVFLYVVSTLFAVANIIPSLVILVMYGESLCFWLGFFLTIWMAAMGVYDLSALYHKRVVKGDCHIAVNIIYAVYSLITIIIFSKDMEFWWGR